MSEICLVLVCICVFPLENQSLILSVLYVKQLGFAHLIKIN